MEQQQREAFEAVARHLGLSLEKNSIDGEYISNETWGVFHVWQESLASELRSLRDSLALAKSHIGELREALEAFMALDKSFNTICQKHLDEMAKEGPMARAVKLARSALKESE